MSPKTLKVSSIDMRLLCDDCWYYTYDEEDDAYYCDLCLDEDEYAKLLLREREGKPCKYYRPDIGEYGIVRKQN